MYIAIWKSHIFKKFENFEFHPEESSTSFASLWKWPRTLQLALRGAERAIYDSLVNYIAILLPLLMATCSSPFIAQNVEFIIIFSLPIKNCLISHVWFSRKNTGCFTLRTIFKKGASGIEPPTSRSAVECSTTEQRSLKQTPLIFQNVFFKTMLLA